MKDIPLFKKSFIDFNYNEKGLFILSNKSDLTIKINGEFDFQIENNKTRIEKGFVEFEILDDKLIIFLEDNDFIIKCKKYKKTFIELIKGSDIIAKIEW